MKLKQLEFSKMSLPKPNSQVVKRNFKIFINLNYIAGFLYAFYFYITSPKSTHMLERRLWAYECWIILSFYGLFIYLFYLEKSAVGGRRGLFRFMTIQAVRLVKVPARKLVSWFEHIDQHPENYSFSTHQGVRVIRGSLTKPGSIFTTKEKFLFVSLHLKFEVTEVDDERGFGFKLLNPFLQWLGIEGAFLIKPLDEDLTRLELLVYNHPQTFVKRVISGFLYLSPVRLAISRQIQKEVNFIGRRVERNRD